MRVRQRQRLETFKRVITFVDGNAALFAKAPPSYAVQVQALRDAIARIEQGSADRGTGASAQTVAQRRALREVLRVKHLVPLRKVAQVASRTIPGLPELVPVPKPMANLRKLLDVARAAERDLEPYRQEIVNRGFPEDFLGQLRGAIAAVEQVHSANATARLVQAGARGELLLGVQTGVDAVRCLDIVVRRACDEDPSTGEGPLAAWNAIVPPARRADRRVNRYARTVGQGSEEGSMSQ